MMRKSNNFLETSTILSRRAPEPNRFLMSCVQGHPTRGISLLAHKGNDVRPQPKTARDNPVYHVLVSMIRLGNGFDPYPARSC
jgi:hypothetical protein